MKNDDKNFILKKKQEAYSLFKNYNFPKAIKLLNKIILEDNVTDSACFFLLGTSYLHEKELELAENNLKISMKLNNKFYDTIHNLGVVTQLKSNYDEAINFFYKALELNPKSLGTLNQLAECYEKSKSFDNAKKFYNKTLEIDKNNKIAFKGLARIYLKFGYHKQGLEYFQKSSGLLRFTEKEFKIIT
tara:strand:- start:404 stop:967 length:564 start_codon:yes stop_codon:yes gene_type:complete